MSQLHCSGVLEGDEDDAGRFVAVERTEWKGRESLEEPDAVVREEPLEIRIGGIPVAVVMRTPGHDRELATGFLVAERVVERVEDLRSVRHCDAIEDPDAEDNVIQVLLSPEVDVDLGRLRRNVFAGSSCGLCGRTTIEDLRRDLPGLGPGRPCWTPEQLRAMPERLRERQAVFDRTGGLHGAGLFDREGRLLVVREDVGRHNAVDKVVGWALATGRTPAALVVSGRVSFDIVQKALVARIPTVVAVSAPSSLAVELAREGGLTLAAFVRGDRCCVYAGGERIAVTWSGPPP